MPQMPASSSSRRMDAVSLCVGIRPASETMPVWRGLSIARTSFAVWPCSSGRSTYMTQSEVAGITSSGVTTRLALRPSIPISVRRMASKPVSLVANLSSRGAAAWPRSKRRKARGREIDQFSGLQVQRFGSAIISVTDVSRSPSAWHVVSASAGLADSTNMAASHHRTMRESVPHAMVPIEPRPAQDRVNRAG